MFNDIDNRPAQTQNEPTARPQLTELLQTTQLCGVSLSVYGTPAEPLFKAKEVADILGLTNPSDLIQRVDEDERAKFNLGRQGETWLLTEQGLYEVLMQSRKPVARQFKAGVKALLKALRTGEQPAANSQQLTANLPVPTCAAPHDLWRASAIRCTSCAVALPSSTRQAKC